MSEQNVEDTEFDLDTNMKDNNDVSKLEPTAELYQI